MVAMMEILGKRLFLLGCLWKETWFQIEVDTKTGKVSKTCGDSTKLGCKEGNTW